MWRIVSSAGSRGSVERARLRVERALVIGEHRSHQRRAAARVDVGRRLRVVLDHRAEQPVEMVVGGQEVLELVEADDGERSVVRVEARAGCRGPLEQDLARLLRVRRRPIGPCGPTWTVTPVGAMVRPRSRREAVQQAPAVRGQRRCRRGRPGRRRRPRSPRGRSRRGALGGPAARMDAMCASSRLLLP